MLILGSKEKLDACKGLGADVCINYKTEDFVERIKEETNGKGIILPPFWPFVMVDTLKQRICFALATYTCQFTYILTVICECLYKVLMSSSTTWADLISSATSTA
jgi:hypothetical protein